MRTICMYFQIHQPFRLRRYRFFDIGNEHYYYDDYSNESIMRRVSDSSYLKANTILLDLIKKHKDRFKVAFSISGLALDQFELYAPEVLESFKQLAKTGQVEFLCETDSHSLVSLVNREQFTSQVVSHRDKIQKYFGQKPTIFRNTELIYSDIIGTYVADLGFDGMVTEGAKQILGWKSPNYLYCSAVNPRLKLLLRNFRLSDDLSFNFSNNNWSEFPLTTEKFTGWLNKVDKKEENINIFIDYETFGGRQKAESGIFDFLKHLPESVFKHSDYTFSKPSEVVKNQQPIAPISVPYPISWADEERDITAWLGNDMQNEAFSKLNELHDEIGKCNDARILADWRYIQSSDHFYYMSTKFFSDRPAISYVNPYGSPYDAFINYMNVLSDFKLRLKKHIGENNKHPEVHELLKLLNEKEKIINQYQTELHKVQTKIATTKGPKKEKTESKTPKSGIQKKKVIAKA